MKKRKKGVKISQYGKRYSWSRLPPKEKESFVNGYLKNKHAEEIQRKEIESNILRRNVQPIS